MSGGGINVSRRQAEIAVINGECLLPGKVIAANTATAWVYVGKGNVCRVRLPVGDPQYIAFAKEGATHVANVTSPDTVEVQTIATTDAYHVVFATEDYIRTSVNKTRLEVIQA